MDGRPLGRGYGHESKPGREALSIFRDAAGLALDATYSAKAAAGAIALVRERATGPVVFWSTKSSAPLPLIPLGRELPRHAPARIRAWLFEAQRTLAER